MQEKVLRRLTIKAFHVRSAVLGEQNDVTMDGKLTLCGDGFAEILKEEPGIARVDIEIIQPGDVERETHAILDIFPLSAKVAGKLGTGITHTLTGVYFMLTGVDTNGKEVARYGGPFGSLAEHISLGKAGTPGAGDIIVALNVTMDGATSHTRETMTAAYRVCDAFCQGLRDKLRRLDGNKCTEQHEFSDKVKRDRFRVAIFKQVPGQGAMFNTQVFSHEPSGVLGGNR